MNFDETLTLLNDQSGWKSRNVSIVQSIVLSDHLQKISYSLKNNPSIRSLYINSCSITEDVIIDFLQELNHFSLIKLTIVATQLRDKSICVIATRMQECLLQYLDLSDNLIGPCGAKSIALALNDCGLKGLILANNKIGNVGCKAIADVLKKGKTTLCVLNLRNNNISRSSVYLFESICVTRIESLDLSFNKLKIRDNDNTTINKLCNILKRSPLKRLYLRNNRLNDTDVISISNVLNKSSISDIWLCMNNITDVGAIFLANTLKNNPNIQTVSLKGNRITNDACLKIGNMFKTHISLKNFLLESSEISVEILLKFHEGIINLQSNTSRIMITICSVRLNRLSSLSSIKVLPNELFRKLHCFLI
jgi:hypothetical protein